MPFTPEQEQLFSDLAGSLPKDGDEAALVRRVERCLGALLRREGDQEFRTVVLNAFTSGLPNHSAEERVDLAEHVLHIVVEKRPEIAIAWVLANGKAAEVPLKRRESDRLLAEEGIPPSSIASKAEPQAQAEAETPAESESAEAQPEPPPYAHDWIEAMVSEYLCHALERKLKVFHLPATDIPSVTYCFTAPF
ncbi:MAG: hypothetical protein K2Q10_13565, partial [Rhodospirillales bacterium]|nr:hypothetical protein [Rhodospirillales bacterium]